MIRSRNTVWQLCPYKKSKREIEVGFVDSPGKFIVK